MTAESQDTEETLARLAGIFHLSDSILSRWQKAGVDVQDAREVVRKVWASRTTAPAWQSTIDSLQGKLDADTERYWRREKLRLESEKLEIANSMARGDQYKREDVDRAMMGLGAAFKLALAETQSTLPPQLAGLTEAEIEKVLADHNRKILGDLSDMGSALWTGILATYRSTSEADPAPATKAKSRKIAVAT